MRVYQNTKAKFLDDILTNDIENIILKEFRKKLLRSTNESEIGSWKDSLQQMYNIMVDQSIPDDCNVAVEFQIPLSSKRIDFTIAGKNETGEEQVILVELKRWSAAELTDKDGIVKTRFKHGPAETSHPSYQAWSYSALLNGFNQTVYDENISLIPCAYLHNYTMDGVINHPFYGEYIEKAPLFLKSDALKLRDFIKKYIRYGDDKDILFRIDSGKIKPSKILADNIVSLLRGNKEFVLIDDQKVVFENAMALAKQSSENKKNVLIVEGGPGTGKSVVAINLLVQLTKLGLNTRYVSKNAAPRAVYESKLTGKLKKSEISNFFSGSGAFIDSNKNTFDVLIVDEAHRLNEKSGLYGNLGENQIKELINAAKFTVFFLDEDQRVTLNDIGGKDEILRWAYRLGAACTQIELESQFRCNGSQGYLAWLDHILQIRSTANTDLADLGFDFKVIGSPTILRDVIFEKNKIDNRARLVAGYCWKWISKNDKRLFDISFPEYDFAMKWNLSSDGPLWIASPNSVNEIGCIHTCQGLEVDYIGVIVGNDFVIRDGVVKTNPAMRASSDSSTRTYKKLYEKKPLEGPAQVDRIIKNTYRTLMTRGMKGCYVYFNDSETRQFFMSFLV